MKAGRRFRHDMPFGAQLSPDGSVRFRLWAPAQLQVLLLVDHAGHSHELPMENRPDGWFELVVGPDRASAGDTYRYRLAGGLAVPDPASRFQPGDALGPSQIVDPESYGWRNHEWAGRPWEETVLSELHVGAFSPEGDYDGLRRRLDHFVDLGISAIELMPLADFDGRRNWGYDGVLPFAPDSAYGPPAALKRLIDEAHGRDLMVFIDVVYNHFGPSGNFLARYAPAFFTPRHHTPWGNAINFDDAGSEIVRRFFVDNALYWLNEYRFDGLRFDAVHAIRDDSRRHVLEEIAATVLTEMGGKRHCHLVLENDDNAAHHLERKPEGEPRTFVAQWNDDFHHACHVVMTGEREGYYLDYAAEPLALLGRVLAEGFAYQGEPSPHRDGAKRGEPSGALPSTAFVSFLQNHDQIGNRAFGERIGALAPPEALRAFHAVLLLSPQIPMLFMGEEWDCDRPFLFFCDFDEPLATAVREGRRKEFERFSAFRDAALRERIPDPTIVETFMQSRLDWSEQAAKSHKAMQEFLRELITIRRRAIVPRLAGAKHGGDWQLAKDGLLQVTWPLGDGSELSMVANLTRHWAIGANWKIVGERLFSLPHEFPRDSDELAPWSVCFALDPGSEQRSGG